ncbi:aminotransferase class I and II [Exophiala viscosa]|uniref:serine C-palmitoyltransferase n=2 Tax=Exophiala viscosa TaxID=2486360 RepID=A0AAN6DW43_9EURO|nr:aminotransferase class I and II [Exophiala viscosa]
MASEVIPYQQYSFEKIRIQIHERNTGSDSSSSISTKSAEVNSLLPNDILRVLYQPPRTSTWAKVREGGRLLYTRARVVLRDSDTSSQPISEPGKFNHHYVHPLFTQKGKNERVILSVSHGKPLARVRDKNGNSQEVIQSASHNYAGFLGCSQDGIALHQILLAKLPVVNCSDVSPIEKEARERVATFWQADFCLFTSTGYGSNLLAFSAILDKTWMVVLDEKSHNSMFVAAYQSQPGLIRKFRHNDMNDLEKILDACMGQCTNTLVAVEGFFSMDGTIPDLAGLSSLKERFGFTLLVDEAHSFLALGATGRGCVELWNEDETATPVSSDLIDIRTATLSKAIGSIGGTVCAKAVFGPRLTHRRDEMVKAGFDPPPTSALVQCLYVLGQPTMLNRSLKRLRSITIFVRQTLHRAGLYIYGCDSSPILPIYAGRPSVAAKLSYVLRQQGVLASPVSTPAVPFWESRVRLCLSAGFDDSTVHRLLQAILEAAHRVGLIKLTTSTTVPPCKIEDIILGEQESWEASSTEKHIKDLIAACAVDTVPTVREGVVHAAGHDALSTYGLGAGGTRWVVGSTELHVQVEELVVEITGAQDALTYQDSYIGLMSTVAALCRPVHGYKKHCLFVPQDMPAAVEDGIRVAPRAHRPEVTTYTNLKSLTNGMRCLRSRSTYATVVLTSQEIIDQQHLEDFMNRALGEHAGMTILLIDEKGVGTFSCPRNIHGGQDSPRLLLYGSFFRAYNLLGSYLAGDPALIMELRYTSRGYMFSTSQLPFIMGMIAAELQKFADGLGSRPALS